MTSWGESWGSGPPEGCTGSSEAPTAQERTLGTSRSCAGQQRNSDTGNNGPTASCPESHNLVSGPTGCPKGPGIQEAGSRHRREGGQCTEQAALDPLHSGLLVRPGYLESQRRLSTSAGSFMHAHRSGGSCLQRPWGTMRAGAGTCTHGHSRGTQTC